MHPLEQKDKTHSAVKRCDVVKLPVIISYALKFVGCKCKVYCACSTENIGQLVKHCMTRRH